MGWAAYRRGNTRQDPQRQAAALAQAARSLLAEAARHARAFLHGVHDLRHVDVGGRTPELVASVPAAQTFHEPRAAELQEKLLQIVERDLLALSDGRKRHRAAVAVLGQIGHGHHCVTASCVEFHRLHQP